MDVKAQVMQALLSGKDPAEALRQQLLKDSGTSEMANKFDNVINSMKQVINFKIISDQNVPYQDIDSLLADFDHFEEIYKIYPQLESVVKPLVGMIEARNKFNLN